MMLRDKIASIWRFDKIIAPYSSVPLQFRDALKEPFSYYALSHICLVVTGLTSITLAVVGKSFMPWVLQICEGCWLVCASMIGYRSDVLYVSIRDFSHAFDRIFALTFMLFQVVKAVWYFPFAMNPRATTVELVVVWLGILTALVFKLLAYKAILNLSPMKYKFAHSMWHVSASLCMLTFLVMHNRKQNWIFQGDGKPGWFRGKLHF